MKHLCKGTEQTLWRSRAHGVWFRLCAVCLSVYISYIVYLSRSSLIASPFRTALALGLFVLIGAGV